MSIKQTFRNARRGEVSDVISKHDILLDKCTIAVTLCSPPCRLDSGINSNITFRYSPLVGEAVQTWQDGTNDSRGQS